MMALYESSHEPRYPLSDERMPESRRRVLRRVVLRQPEDFRREPSVVPPRDRRRS